MALDTLFAAGLLFSMASQLRLPGSTILGPGEICLGFWVLLSLGRRLFLPGPTLTLALSRMLMFWLLFTVAESLGTLTGAFIQDVHDPQWFMHDILAYLLLASLSCLSVADPDAGFHLRRTAWLLVVLGAGSLVFQLAAAQGLVEIPEMDPWYWDRLRGWAATPNQLSIICLALILLSVHLAETTDGSGKRIAAWGCAVLPAYAGWLTQSDTFNLVLVIGIPAYVALKFRKWTISPEWKSTFRSRFAWIIILALPLTAVLAAPFVPLIVQEMGSLAKDMSKEGGKATDREAELRFHLWHEAISRGLDAGLLGLGPGPHLSIPSALVAARQSKDQPKNIAHPQPGAIPNFEAHNTLFDLFAQGGLLADLTFIWLAASTVFIGYKAGCDSLTVLVAGLCLFGLFHFIIRQPIFWYAIGFCLVASADRRRLHGTVGGRGVVASRRLA